VRIFVGYHYGPSDTWVKSLVYRMVRAFGHELESGEQLYLGPNIADAIIAKIRGCDALIGVASRRGQPLNGVYGTHQWVQHELATAKAHGKLFVQLREAGIDPQLGILEGAQYIEYDAVDLAECLVKLAEALGQWNLLRSVSPHLVPWEFATAVAPVINSPEFVCQCAVFDTNFDEKSLLPTRIVRTPGGLRAMLKGIPVGHSFKLSARFRNQQWESEVTCVDSPCITMNPMAPN
jgi:hypothetical protein